MIKNKDALRNVLITVALRIKEFGYNVFVASDGNFSFGYYSDGTHIAYFQANEHGDGVELATCNKTPGSFGHHFFIERGSKGVDINQLTKEYLEKAFVSYPVYFDQEDIAMMPVSKHINLDDFLSGMEDGFLQRV